jgi:hypothetical protein
MCATCGCGIPEDDHGDPRHIKWSQIEAAAQAAGSSPEEAIRNAQEMAKKQGS